MDTGGTRTVGAEKAVQKIASKKIQSWKENQTCIGWWCAAQTDEWQLWDSWCENCEQENTGNGLGQGQKQTMEKERMERQSNGKEDNAKAQTGKDMDTWAKKKTFEQTDTKIKKAPLGFGYI